MRKFLLLFFSILSLNLAHGQVTTTSSISGTVVDEKGQTLPGVTIVATHTPTGTVYTTVTRADGKYNLANLRIGGPYTIKFSFVGYNPSTEDNINLTLGQDFKLGIKLDPSSTLLKEVKVSSGQNKVINNSRTGSQEIVTRSQIDRLPTINRSIYDYTKLTPSANGRSFGGRNDSFNNLTVDGALFNNSFGLSSTLGGQTNSQPISLDAIEQIQVAVSPFDVTLGRFAGTGINTVTKSGTNQFKGSVYLYKRTTGLQGTHVGNGIDVAKSPIDYNQRGISLGGPIIKNKLFLFVSGEQEREKDPSSNYTALRPGQTAGGTVSQAGYGALDSLRTFLKTKYGYDPGAFENFQLRTQSDKITARLDWNIDDKNTLSVKYFYLKSLRDVAPSNSGSPTGGRQPSAFTLPFFSSFYTINNNFNIGIAELNTRFSSTIANKLTVGYQALRDFRQSPGGGAFPLVDIQNGSSTAKDLTAFGYEPFTAFNVLNTDIYQLSDNVTIYKGNHEINVGTSNEIDKFKNGFAPNYNGAYVFSSLSDFYASANSGTAFANQYSFRYAATPDGSFPYAKINASTIGLFVQDKWQVTDRFKLTYGIRADLPIYSVNSQQNTNVAALTFRDGVQLDVSKFPKTRIQLSPRVGFNWDVNGDATTQVRGGLGIFTGPTPYVWVSNQASNNGVQFGSYTIQPGKAGVSATDPRLVFNPNPDANRPPLGSATATSQYNLAVVDRNFKNPKNFRGDIAVDQKLPWGIVGTLEFMYSKDINAVYQQNVALPSTGTALVGPDNRLVYSASTLFPAVLDPVTKKNLNTPSNPNISDAELMTNTSKGYTYNATIELQKSLRELNFTLAYTHSDSRSVNDGGSVAQSIWSGRPVSGDPNANETGYSNFYLPNRIIASVSYRKAYTKNLATSVGLTYEGANNGVASYTYSGDLNNDGVKGNDLIYIPRTQSDIVLVANGATDKRTSQQLWDQLNAYIGQDPYLSKHRGQYAQRNGLLLPFFNQINLNITQDIFVTTGKVKNTLQIEFNMINLGNFIDRNWGNYKFVNSSQFLSFQKIAPAGDPNAGKPEFSFPYFNATTNTPLTQTFGEGTSIASRWQAQFGLRYIFN
ncbi:TonB-dependent receptor [Mucilaginibacter sp. BJC16-A38]|uniref:TonB-dependent receptor n=1 Tax=Mucilaginibacter phenanthrenivorans TaxID=1234842 RepID=UPI002158702A|nr:carboxypeptidase regulatory-like domain-containing protein [Mucilaginibacter phenanthrenivorans]MCR8557163.1 TonB-dependent receptor [Mucilaginibacter phenanthrenivorans]